MLDETSGPDQPTELQMEHKFIRILLGVDRNQQALGTIQDAAAYGEVEFRSDTPPINYPVPNLERTPSRTLPGSIAHRAGRITDDAMRLGLVRYYTAQGAQVHFPLDAHPPNNSQPLASHAEIFHYALLDGRRITSTTASKRGSIGSSLIQIHFNREIFVGEVQHIFRPKQAGVLGSNDALQVHVKWMQPTTSSPLNGEDPFIWNKL